MAGIELSRASVSIPVYDYSARKLLRARWSHLGARGNRSRVRHVAALQNLSMTLRDGDRLGIVGKNGSGKTTLLRMLSGVYSPTGGKITTSGKIVSLLDISFGIEPDLTGRESIDLRASILGTPRSQITGIKDEIIEFSGLGEFIDMPTRTYSSGMLLRLAFSIVTSVSPEILIMDEWLSVGDQDFQTKAEERLRSLVASTRIVVVASHSRSLIESTCNRALFLEDGQGKLFGSPESVCSAYFDGPKLD